MTLNLHWHGLMSSQKKSLIAGISGITALIAGNAPGIVAELHEWGLPPKVLHALTVAVGAIAYYYTMKGRSLDTSNSGTNTGLIDRGPDTWAAQTAVNEGAGVSTLETSQNAPTLSPASNPAPSASDAAPPTETGGSPITAAEVQNALGHD